MAIAVTIVMSHTQPVVVSMPGIVSALGIVIGGAADGRWWNIATRPVAAIAVAIGGVHHGRAGMIAH